VVLHERALPPSWPTLLLLSAMIFLPVGLVAIQPDLGTAALIAIAGVLVIVMAGLSVRIMGGLLASVSPAPGSAGTSCTTTSASAC